MELFGYKNKIGSFTKLIKEKRLSQAYLFYGDRGIGKSIFAKLLSYALETGKFETAIEPLLDASFIVRGPEENSLGIEKILEVKRFLWQKPLKSQYRLAVINNAEDLTPEAQGALLKIVEEPPAHALIIFITHDSQTLLPPLLSRLMKIYFPRLPKAEIAKVLSENHGVNKGRAREVADRSFGRLGRALDLLKGKPEFSEDDLESFLEDKILKLRGENLKKNAEVLNWLLDRETLVKRYNLNMNLQKKAASEMLNNPSPFKDLARQ
jgi:MoxR-like ATPase